MTLVLSIITLAGILIGWGKSVQRFNSLEADHKDLEEKVSKLNPDLSSRVGAQQLRIDGLDETITGIEFTLWGPQKNNGMYSKVNEMYRTIIAVQERNRVIDALAEERQRGANMAGLEERERNRRREDKLIRGSENG